MQNAQNISHAAENPRSLAVLVVDDEPLIRWSLVQGLGERGHRVATAGTAAEALTAVARSPHLFDVVILDYRLPDCRDLSLLGEIRQRSPDSVVMMMTAFGEDQMRSDATTLGAQTVIDKPFQVKSLISLVEAAVNP